MKEAIPAEQKIDDVFSTFSDIGYAPMDVRQERTPAIVDAGPETAILDSFLSSIKWIFVYLPGAAALHFGLMGMSLFIFYGGPTFEMMIGAFGISLVSVFMVMLGVGRLTDLRYLRVVGGILATAALASVLYSISIVFIPGDFFGWFTLLTMPLTIIIGQLIKLKTDRETLPHE